MSSVETALHRQHPDKTLKSLIGFTILSSIYTKTQTVQSRYGKGEETITLDKMDGSMTLIKCVLWIDPW